MGLSTQDKLAKLEREAAELRSNNNKLKNEADKLRDYLNKFVELYKRDVVRVLDIAADLSKKVHGKQ